MCGHRTRVHNILSFLLQCIEDFAHEADEDESASDIGLASSASRRSSGVVPIGPMPLDLMMAAEDASPFHTTPESFMSADSLRTSDSAAKPVASAES